MKSRFLWSLLALVVTAAPALAQPPEKDDGRFFFFKDGDTIVIMGDSITEQHLYSNYVEMWSVSRFPKRNLTFRNVGIGGDRSTGGNARFKRDVLAHKATVLTVDFGMNDGNYKPFDDKTFQVYMNGLQGIADQAAKAKIRVAWITPQPIEKRDAGSVYQGYNQTLEKFSEGVGEIAVRNKGLFVDQFHPYLAVLAKARSADPKNINITGGDAVHPAGPGQIVMAAAILKRLDFQRLIARVSIDLDPSQTPKPPKTTKGKTGPAKDKAEPVKSKGGPTIEAENCTVDAFTARSTTGEDGISFTCLPSGLPFFPEEAKSILKWAPILEDMNRYLLEVRGLKAGMYAVQLGDTKIAEYSAADLAKGVNLAGPMLAAGPVAEQVKKVWTAVKDKNKYFHDQVFRGVVLASPKSPIFKDVDAKEIEAKRQEVYNERMKKMPELDGAVRATLALQPHTVKIVPLKQ